MTQQSEQAPMSHSDSLHAEQVGYKQSLGRRHVQMIAIGGAIGTGLFLGSASRLHSTGPGPAAQLRVRRASSPTS